MVYRNAGDFLALAPPQNDEVEVIGYIYRRPSSKLQDKEEGKGEGDGKKKGQSAHEAVKLD
jgi:hypothetical protein